MSATCRTCGSDEWSDPRWIARPYQGDRLCDDTFHNPPYSQQDDAALERAFAEQSLEPSAPTAVGGRSGQRCLSSGADQCRETGHKPGDGSSSLQDGGAVSKAGPCEPRATRCEVGRIGQGRPLASGSRLEPGAEGRTSVPCDLSASDRDSGSTFQSPARCPAFFNTPAARAGKGGVAP